MKKRLLLFFSIFAIIIAGVLYIFPPRFNNDTIKYAHVSIDDCMTCFKDLTIHEHTYNTIFDQPLFEYLRRLNKQYGFKVTLYAFLSDGDFDISKVPHKFFNDFNNNKDWLKVSFHGIKPLGKLPNCFSSDEYIVAYDRFVADMKNWGGAEIRYTEIGMVLCHTGACRLFRTKKH